MAIVNNISTEDGDVLQIQTDVPVVGIVSLTSFADTTVGETGSVYFDKYFRYSTNGGLTFTDWIQLTTINIQNIVIEKTDAFVIQYKYQRVGLGGTLEFDNVQVDGTYSPLTYPVFNNMIFSSFFTPNGVDVLNWALNVLEKLYKRGIVPAYVTRDAGGDDSDYIAYWFTVTHFFAILVYYARQFENIQSSVLMMREFVKGRGVYMRNNPDTDELYYVFDNYIQEILQRGTRHIAEREGQLIAGGEYYNGEPIGGDLIYAEADGELLRLLDNVLTDEFLFALTARGELGWCIGESSPMYTGADNIMNLIKGYEFDETVSNLNLYPLINPLYITLINSQINIASIPNGQVAGIGLTPTSLNAGGLYGGQPIGADLIYEDVDISEAFVIDPSLDYEISFRVQKSALTKDLSFGVALFDINGNTVYPVRITDGTVEDRFFAVKGLNLTNTAYWVRGVLYAYPQSLMPSDALNIGFGQNLRASSNAVYMFPVILVENNSGGVLTDAVKIWDVKVRPAALWFSRGMLSARNFIIGFLKNNSVLYNNDQIENIINEELIPYNTFTKLNFL